MTSNMKHETVLYCTTVLVTALICSSFSARNELTAITTCTCPGYPFIYECTVIDGLFTVWRGNIIANDCEITLRHTDFPSATGMCSQGNLRVIGRGIEVQNNCYISQLTLMITSNMNNKTVECHKDDGSDILIGVLTLYFSQNPTSPPSDVRLLYASQDVLMFNWTAPLSNCPSLDFIINSENCGICPNTTALTTINCTDFSLSQNCSLSLYSVICGNITSVNASRTTRVILQVPERPVIINSVPRFLKGSLRTNEDILMSLTTEFRATSHFNISDNFDGSARSYTITYTDSVSGRTCGSVTIPADVCSNGVCKNVFDVFHSTCPRTNGINVTVIAVNVLGSGPESDIVMNDGNNTIVEVTYDPSKRTIQCNFLNQPLNIIKQCTANITRGTNCGDPVEIYTNMNMDSSLVITTLPNLGDNSDTFYCFEVTANTSYVTVIVEGELNSLIEINNNATVPVIIAVVITVVILLLLSVPIILFVIFLKRRDTTTPLSEQSPTEYIIVFSIKDKKGTLYEALEAFTDAKIYRININTHLHPPDYKWVLGSRRIFYFHCLCSRKNRRHLETSFEESKFKEQFIVGDEEIQQQKNDSMTVPACIKVMVDDDMNVQELRSVLKIFKDGDINMSLNLCSDRRNYEFPGYNMNRVQCWCTQNQAEYVAKQLTGKGAVAISYKTAESTSQAQVLTKSLSFSVKNDVGNHTDYFRVFDALGMKLRDINPLGDISTRRHFYIECDYTTEKREKLFQLLKSDKDVKAECHEDPCNQPSTVEKKVSKNHIVQVSVFRDMSSSSKIFAIFDECKIAVVGINYGRNSKLTYEVIDMYVDFISNASKEKDMIDKLHETGLVVNVGVARKYAGPEIKDHEDYEMKRRVQISVLCSSHDKSQPYLLTDALQAMAKVFEELKLYVIGIDSAVSTYVECTCNDSEQLKREVPSVNTIIALPDQGPSHSLVKFSGGLKNLKAFFNLDIDLHEVNPEYIIINLECHSSEESNLAAAENELKEAQVVIYVKKTRCSNEDTTRISCHFELLLYKTLGLADVLSVFKNCNVIVVNFNDAKKRVLKCEQFNVTFDATREQQNELEYWLKSSAHAVDIKSKN